MKTWRLADLKPGDSGIVTAIAGNGRLTCRLMELGMVPGVTVQVLRKAPFGDPVQYRVRGAVISMRAAEAAGITVCDCSPEQMAAADVPDEMPSTESPDVVLAGFH